MKNLKTIQQLSEQLEQLVNEDFNNLQSMELIPDNLTSDNEEYFDWLYSLPVIYNEDKHGLRDGFYITKVIRKNDDLVFEGIGINDHRETTNFYPFEFSTEDKIILLQCVNDTIKSTATISQP